MAWSFPNVPTFRVFFSTTNAFDYSVDIIDLGAGSWNLTGNYGQTTNYVNGYYINHLNNNQIQVQTMANGVYFNIYGNLNYTSGYYYIMAYK
jgi:hypothetical protein